MIFVFTGNGKGKTTAALGQCLRALGQGKRIIFIEFIKSNKFPSGEDGVLSKLGIELIKGGLGFVGILGDKLPKEKHRREALKTFARAEKAVSSRRYDLVVLDEINVAVSLGLVPIPKVISLLKKISKDVDLILTGRSAAKKIVELADLATEFKEIKHHFKRGIVGQKGREY